MTDQSLLITNTLRTTSSLLNQAAKTFFSTTNPTRLLLFTLLSLLLFSFRSLVEDGSHLLTSFIDRDPSLKSLLRRLPPPPHHHHNHRHHRHRRQSPPFLLLTRVGTLDDDFFSTDDDLHRANLNPHLRVSPNGTSVNLSNFGGNFNRLVRSGSGLQFKIEEQQQLEDIDDDLGDGVVGRNENEGSERDGNEGSERGEVGSFVDLRHLIKGLELGRRDTAALFVLVSFLSAAYGWVILGFTMIYALILGVAFVVVVNDLLGRYTSVFGDVWDGSKLGFKRLTGFILMRWAVRDALTQIVGLWYFGEIEDQFSFFKLFVRLKLLPFSVMSPWIQGFEKEISGFLFAWFLLDAAVGLVFAVDAWVTMADSRRTGREIVKEGCYLTLMLINQAVQIKCFESILCGAAARWVLNRLCGQVLAAVIQAILEVYFMVAWLIFYFAARGKEAQAEGRRFGKRELEGLIDGLR